ncbi:hypothetical protein NHF46_00725 [Arthrobacter alpinus]|nr:hypothetical protein [Arthrobacter alpinus]
MAATALTDLEVAARLKITPAMVHRYENDHRIYSYKYSGSIKYPLWQFIEPNKGPIPGLHKILRIIPDGMHPQVVTGFFNTIQADLTINDTPVTIATWLTNGGDIDVVLEMTRSLGWTL